MADRSIPFSVRKHPPGSPERADAVDRLTAPIREELALIYEGDAGNSPEYRVELEAQLAKLEGSK